MTAVLDIPKVTPAELLARPDGFLYELVNGDLVERNRGWRSSQIGFELGTRLGVHVREHNLGCVNGADAGYQCYADALPDDPDRIRNPDVSFISLDRMPPIESLEGYCDVVPDLVVEVVSPNDLVYDIWEKIEEYRKAGVKLIWVVVPNTKTVSVFRLDGSTDELHENDELSGEDVVPGFRCKVADIFRAPVRAKA